MNFTIEGPHLGKASVCIPVLRSLPEWFGIEEAIVQYSTDIDHLSTFLACNSGHVLGFLSLKQHNPYSAEVYVMGVGPGFHRHGIGRALMNEAERWLMKDGVEYLQVKTLGPSNNDPGYVKTRAFYLTMGFRPLEEFKHFWNKENPCLILIKRL